MTHLMPKSVIVNKLNGSAEPTSVKLLNFENMFGFLLDGSGSISLN